MKTEATIQDSAKLDIQELGGYLYRNNSGVDNSRQRPIRYGLGNDSAPINKIRKSADLIGLVPVLITAAHLGMTLGVFISAECKKEGWKYSDKNPHFRAQNNFNGAINSRGGLGFFLNDTGILVPHIQKVLKLC